MDTMEGVSRSLKGSGIFIFDLFNAAGIFDNLEDFETTVRHDGKVIRRISTLKMNLATGWTYDWTAKYIVEEDGKVTETDDLTTLRAFTRDEIVLFLRLTGFEVKEISEEPKVINLIAGKR
jgi:hypothetical protein